MFYCMQGILGAYQFAVSQVQLYGPTNFSSILDRAMAMAKEPLNQQQQSYYILLVITVSTAPNTVVYKCLTLFVNLQ